MLPITVLAVRARVHVNPFGLYATAVVVSTPHAAKSPSVDEYAIPLPDVANVVVPCPYHVLPSTLTAMLLPLPLPAATQYVPLNTTPLHFWKVAAPLADATHVHPPSMENEMGDDPDHAPATTKLRAVELTPDDGDQPAPRVADDATVFDSRLCQGSMAMVEEEEDEVVGATSSEALPVHPGSPTTMPYMRFAPAVVTAVVHVVPLL